MESLTQITLKALYLLFIASVDNPTFAKTGLGITQWCPEKVVGQLGLKGIDR